MVHRQDISQKIGRNGPEMSQIACSLYQTVGGTRVGTTSGMWERLPNTESEGDGWSATASEPYRWRFFENVVPSCATCCCSHSRPNTSVVRKSWKCCPVSCCSHSWPNTSASGDSSKMLSRHVPPVAVATHDQTQARWGNLENVVPSHDPRLSSAPILLHNHWLDFLQTNFCM